jgi:hypothetical protein
MWTIRNRYGHRYASICIFPIVSLSNRRCLTRLHDLGTWYGNRGICTCSPSNSTTRQGQVARRSPKRPLRQQQHGILLLRRWLLEWELSYKNRSILSVYSKFRQQLPYMVRFPKLARKRQHKGQATKAFLPTARWPDIWSSDLPRIFCHFWPCTWA